MTDILNDPAIEEALSVPKKWTEKPTKRKVKARAKAKPAEAKQARDELDGLTATSCCNGCLANLAGAQKAQRRLNELEMMYPRMPAQPRIHPVTGWRMPAPTVMEDDEEYLARNPHIAAEFRDLGKAIFGKCQISEHPGCAHPNKGGLQSSLQHDPRVVARFNKAKKMLKHQTIDARE